MKTAILFAALAVTSFAAPVAVKRNFNVALTSDYVGPGVDGKTAEKRGTVAFAPDYVGPGVDGETSAAEKRGGGEGGCGPSKQGLC